MEEKENLSILLQSLQIHIADNINQFNKQEKYELKKNKKPENVEIKPIKIEVEENLDNISNLEELHKYLENLSSPLKDMANNLVFSVGDSKSRIMVIGEAPGEREDIEGKPFVGQSGQLLESIFNTIGLSREKNIYITNIVPWRPPLNRTPTKDEMKFFTPYIKKHIELINPELLLLVGSTAYQTLFPKQKSITAIHGQILELNLNNRIIPSFGLFHPSYLLRAPTNKKLMWEDMLKIKKYLREKAII